MGKELKDLRKEKGLYQKDLAKLLECSEDYYGMIERKEKTPSVKLAKEIERFTGYGWINFFEERMK